MRLARHFLDKIVKHAGETTPAECFGFLVGRPERGGQVLQVVKGANVSQRPEVEYLMDPTQFILVADAAERDGWEVVGFYHSHPKGDARPSPRDVAAFWTDYIYLIVALSLGQVTGISAWRLPPGGENVVQVELVHCQGMDNGSDTI